MDSRGIGLAGIFCGTFLLFVGLIAGGLYATSLETTKQLTSCTEAGGSYMPLDGSPYCLMQGESIPVDR